MKATTGTIPTGASGHRRRRRRQPLSASPSSILSLALLPLSLAVTASAASSSSPQTLTGPSSLPEIDYSRMGTVAFLGSFTGIDFYDPSFNTSSSSSSSFSSSSTNAKFSSTADSLVLRTSSGRGRVLATTNEGGRISSTCWSSHGGDGGTLFLGGEFSALGGIDVINIAKYNIDSGSVSALSRSQSDSDSTLSVREPVNAVYCDDANERVWIGGEFENNVLVYYLTNSTIGVPPFQALNGPVDSISSLSSSSSSLSSSSSNIDPDSITSLLFGGRFTTEFATTTNVTTNMTTLMNSSAPEGTTTVGFSGFLTPISISPSSSNTDSNTDISISAIPTSTQSGFSDPNVLFCPSGSDGSGNSWWAQDGSAAKITVQTYRALQASGIRLGNTFTDGRATTKFSVVSIPDDTQLSLTYVDPITGSNATCTLDCPLSTDSSVQAQDFLFTDGARDLTGFQVYLEGWTGEGPGLHRLQLLSSGSYASAVASDNMAVCNVEGGAETSDVQSTGSWESSTTATGIPGTIQQVLVSSVSTSSSDRPSVTWYPYVASSGYYDVNILIPGCQNMGDCDSRTTVDMEVFPFYQSLGWTSTISQAVNQDTTQRIYSGFIQASTPGSFQPTVDLALAAEPTESGNGKNWQVVAGSIQLVLTSPGNTTTNSTGSSTTGSSSNSTSTTSSTNSTTSSRISFGVFEWPLSNLTAVNASSALNNYSQTTVDRLGIALNQDSTSGSSGRTVLTAAAVGGYSFIGGSFSQSGNYTNVLSTQNGTIAPLAGQGLNGLVRTSIASGQSIIFGGDFTANEGSSTALQHLASYDPSTSSWTALAGGTDGPVNHITQVTSNTFAVTGNFSNVVKSDGSSHTTGGYAIWNTSSSDWDTTGIMFGNAATTTVSGSGDDVKTYLSGRIQGLSGFAASGVALLSGDGSATDLSSLDLGLTPTNSEGSAASSLVARENYRHQSARSLDSWIPRWSVSSPLRKRQSISSQTTSTAGFGANAAAYFTNSTDNANWMALGGNFSSSSGNGLVFLQSPDGQMHGVEGDQLEGAVQQLVVSGTNLFVAGDFTVGSQANIAIYDLSKNDWSSQSIPGLNASSGAIEVNAMKVVPNTETLVVAGNVARAGGLSCVGICSWDITQGRFNNLGNGLGTGVVHDLDFAGSSSDVIIIVGSFTLSGSTEQSYAAKYLVNSSSWSNLGGLPEGVAMAVTADDLSLNNIWVAGQQSNGTPYLQQYDGSSWQEQSTGLETNSVIKQLAFVPLANTRSGSSSIEQDRLLMMSGQLNIGGQTYSAATYDGSTITPYLAGTSADGSSGTASGFSFSIHNFSFHTVKHIAVGLVVLISLAIATGLIFLFCLIGLLILILARRRQKERGPHPDPKPPVIPEKSNQNSSDTQSEHIYRLNQIQKALFGVSTAEALGDHDRPLSQTSSFGGGEALGGVTPRDAGDEGGVGRTAKVRFDFTAEEEGELTVSAGQEVGVIEEDEQWVLVTTGSDKGFIPVSYLF